MTSKQINKLNWIKVCMNSCTDIEQLQNCEVLVGMFIFSLKKDNYPDNLVRQTENELLEHYIGKESQFIIPPDIVNYAKTSL